MTNALKQAAQQALEILDAIGPMDMYPKDWRVVEALRAALSAPQPAQAAPLVTDDVVQRFLGWKLPADFSPDCGISFKRVHSETSPFGPQNYEPTGTNLFTAVQAQAMLEHVLEAGLARKPIWTGADEEMFWLNEIEKYQGGSNGPTIKLRAAILAAAPQPAAPQAGPCDEDARLTAAGKMANSLGIKTFDAYKVIAAYTTPQPAAPQSDPCAPPEIQEAIERGEFEPGQWTVSAQRAIEKNPSGALRIIAKLRDEVAGLKAAPAPAQAVPQPAALTVAEVDKLINTAQELGAARGWDMREKLHYLVHLTNGIKQPGSEAC